VLYAGSPATDGTVSIPIPVNSNRRNLIVIASGTFHVTVHGLDFTANAAFGVPTVMTPFQWDLLGPAINDITALTGLGALAALYVCETIFIESRP